VSFGYNCYPQPLTYLKDEATSSVDVDTDAKLQQTIASQLVSSTLLVIAHRLNTILAFDRILVMDKGKVSYFREQQTA